MKKLKKHWPLLMWIVIAIILPIRQINCPFLSRRFLSWPYFVLFYIIPPCLLITGIWYGVTAGRKKYLFIPLPFIAYFLNDIFVWKSTEGWFDGVGFDSGWYYAFIDLFIPGSHSYSIGPAATGIVFVVIFAAGLLIGECCKRLRKAEKTG